MFGRFMTASKIAFPQINKCIIGTHNMYIIHLPVLFSYDFPLNIAFSVFNYFICITGECLLLSQVQLFIECGLALLHVYLFHPLFY